MRTNRWRQRLVTLLLVPAAIVTAALPAFPAPQESFRAQGRELLAQTRLTEAEAVFDAWRAASPEDPDAHYYLALTRALLGRVAQARIGFEHVLELDPGRADACFEIATTFLNEHDDKAALSWCRRGLRLAPRDEYGVDLLGTIYYVVGAKLEAIRTWNRLSRPQLTSMDIDVSGGVSRQTIADEIDLQPGALLSAAEIERARWRLAQHRYLQHVAFEPVPGSSPDAYSLSVKAAGRRRLGSPSEFLLNATAELGNRTVRANYWNIGGSTMTLASRWRWVPTAQLLQVELDVPRILHVPTYSTWSFVERRESWWIPGAAAFDLHTRQVGARIAVPVWLPRVVLTADVAARVRRFVDAVPPPAEAGALTPTPDVDRETTAVTWFRLTPRLVLPAYLFRADWELRCQVRSGIEAAYTRGPHPDTISRVWGSGNIRADRTLSKGRTVTLDAGLHAGWLSRQGLAEDHFTLGVGSDAEFPLRGHPFLRDGMPGRAPLAGSFLLAGFMVSGDIKTSRWVKVGLFGFVDAARVMRPYPEQSGEESFVDAGIGIDIGPPLFSSSRLSLVWALNGQTRQGSFYISARVR